MKRVLTIITFIVLLVSGRSVLSAQNHPDNRWQDRMKAEKIAFLTNAMDLTSSEAEKFWPIYNRAEAEMRQSWEANMKAFIALDEGIKAGKDEKEISNLLEKYLNTQQSGKDIDAKYLKEYRKVLSNEKIAKLYIGEETFRRMQIHRLNSRNDNSKNDKK